MWFWSLTVTDRSEAYIMRFADRDYNLIKDLRFDMLVKIIISHEPFRNVNKKE